jgi:hypothetical protein
MPSLRAVQQCDYSDLALFLSEEFVEGLSQDYWMSRFRFWWDNNPAFSEDMEKGRLLLVDEKIVGFLGIIPTLMLCFEAEKKVFNLTTWVVKPDYRSLSMQLLLYLMNYCKDTVLFNDTAKEENVGFMRSLKFNPILRNFNKKSFLFVDAEKVIGAKVMKDFNVKWVVSILGWALKGFQAFRLRSLKRPKAARLKVLTEADSSFDELWERTKDLYPMTNVRTSEIVNWYCFSGPDNEKILIGVYDGEKLIGYLICMLSQVRGLRILECLDIWGEPEYENWIPSIILGVKDLAQDKNYDVVIFPHYMEALGVVFIDSGLITMQSSKRIELVRTQSKSFDVINEHNSYLVSQGDYGL